MAVPYTFGTATAAIPLSQLDSNFATAITIGNTAVQLGNTVTTLNNLTLANVTISSGNVTITNVTVTTANATTANVGTLVVTANATVAGNVSVTGNVSMNVATITTANVTTTNTSSLVVTGNAVVSVTDNTNAALRITQLGTGNALLVEDSSNPDSTPFVIDASGKTLVGLTTARTTAIGSAAVQIAGGTAPLSFIREADSSTPINLEFAKARASGAILASGDTIGRLYFSGSDGSNQIPAAYIDAAVDGTPGTNDMPGRLVFSTTADGASSPTERMRIDSSGNLLVGTTATNVTSGGYNFLINDGGTGYSTGYIGHITGCPSGYAYLNFKYAGTTIGTITQNGTTAVAYNTSSDYRLKNTIAPMTGALAKVQALKPVTYKWNADDSDGEGFIAHELAEVCPHAVTGAKDAVDVDGNPVYQGIDTSFLVATLTAAIQEQQALITQLQADVAALKAPTQTSTTTPPTGKNNGS